MSRQFLKVSDDVSCLSKVHDWQAAAPEAAEASKRAEAMNPSSIMEQYGEQYQQQHWQQYSEQYLKYVNIEGLEVTSVGIVLSLTLAVGAAAPRVRRESTWLRRGIRLLLCCGGLKLTGLLCLSAPFYRSAFHSACLAFTAHFAVLSLPCTTDTASGSDRGVDLVTWNTDSTHAGGKMF